MIGDGLDPAIGRLLRDLAPRVLGAVARRHHDFGVAEDAVQEALIAAAGQWPRDGIPANPRGWLYRVSVRRLADLSRSDAARRRREEAVAAGMPDDQRVTHPVDLDVPADEDDTLTLVFMCCHPALTPATAVALTLRAVGGLTTAEIGSAFLVPEATMAQRISRAKQTIRQSNVAFTLPTAEERSGRLAAVLQVLYLIFNEGYTATAGPSLHRTDLSNEAIRLARMLHRLLPADGEVAGLLALMLLTDARRAARTGPAGELIPLDEQDRSLWDRDRLAEGTALVGRALAGGAVGAYQLQAAVAAIHGEAPSVAATDWPQVQALYGLLVRMTGNPMVELSHAIATAMVEGPAAGLALLEPLEEKLPDHHRLHAVRGHLLERAGELDRAAACYRAAADRTASVPERDYLLTRAARLRDRLPRR